MEPDRFNEACQLPEYCPENDGAPRPLVLIGISGSSAVESIVATARARNLDFQHRLLEQQGRDCLAILGPVGSDTDQFLRSLIYVLQQAAGPDGKIAEMLENRLVPQWFTLSRQEKSLGNSGMLQDDIARRHGLKLSGGASFGSGLHPSTRLAIQAFESLRKRDGEFVTSVLDVGCGSGILALVCGRLGARRVLAVDRDHEALATTRRNVAVNDLQQIITVAATPVQEISETRQLVAANLAVSVLRVLLIDLVRLVAQRGFLVLAGFQKGQGETILAHASKMGMELLEEFEQQGWRSFLLRKSGERN